MYELTEAFRIAFAQIRAHKLRSVLTALGVIIGIMAVTLMGMAIHGMDLGFQRSLAMIGDDVFYVQKWPWGNVPDWWNYINRPPILVPENATALNRIIAATPHSLLDVAVPSAGRNMAIKAAGNQVGGVNVFGTNADYGRVLTGDFKDGRLFTAAESDAGRPVCVLGYDVAEGLFPGRPALDETVVLDGGHPFRVIGVLARQGEFLGLFSFDSQAIIPLPSFKKFYGTRRGYAEVIVKVTDKARMDEAADELTGAMRRLRAQLPGERDNFSVNQQQVFKAQLDPIERGIALVGLFVTGLALFVGAIGIMNITFVSVKERTREIGTRKALGARRRTILLQFLIEAVSICLIGGVIGLLGTCGLALGIGRYLPSLPIELSPILVVVGMLVSTMTGIFAGFAPAWEPRAWTPSTPSGTNDFPVMLLKEIIGMALSSLGVHKLRSLLTMAGITIGVFSVIGVMTAVSALRGSFETGLSFLGANTFQFGKYASGIQALGNNRGKYQKRPNISLAQADRYMRLMEGTSDVVCLYAGYGRNAIQATYGGRMTTPTIRYCGSNEYFLETNQFTIQIGRNFAPEDIALRRPVVIIGQTVLRELFPAESPLGKVVTVGGHAYTVIGVFDEKGTAFGGNQDDIAMVPITRLLEDNGAEYISLNIATESPSQTGFNDTLEKGITAMRIVRGLRAGEDNNFELYSNDALKAAFAKIADVVSEGALVISAIALVASGVGIMNIMLVSVTERTKEIGVRKSIGARRVNILAQFLIEAVVLSLTGGLAGILLGIIAGNALALTMHAAVVFPWGWAAAGLCVCTVIGVGFGFYPALRAATLDPIEALRYE